MGVLLLNGPVSWEGEADDDGHRTYKIVWKVACSSLDGPANVMQTPGLPLPGSLWVFDLDVDVYAWCRPNMQVQPVLTGEPNRLFLVTQTFSTRPLSRDQAGYPGGAPGSRGQPVSCTGRIENPLLEPPKVSGGFGQQTKEITRDRLNRPVLSSSHEPLRGPGVEFEFSYDTIEIEQNVASLELDLVSKLKDTVNMDELWGFPPRCVKFSRFNWSRQYHGQCAVYYTRKFGFDIKVNVDPNTGEVTSGWDRYVTDEGTKVLNGHWDEGATTGTADDGGWVLDDVKQYSSVLGTWHWGPPDPSNPAHFIRAKDRNGENMRVMLDGAGKPYDSLNVTTGTSDDEPGKILVQAYRSGNLALLGLPLSF